ncbi:MAG: hypothetical protein WC007_14945 [Pelobacteraceae bacterium]
MWFKKGAFIGLIATIPLVLLCALLFRFPVPFAGYMSGLGAIYPALIAIFFYGVLFGGFIIQALLGGIGGLLAEHYSAHDKHNIKILCIIFSTIGAFLGVLALAILDKIIGPW